MAVKAKLVMVIAAVLALAAALLAILATRPVQLRFAAETDPEARSALREAIAEYDAAQGRVAIALVESAGPEAELSLGPIAEGGIPWRSVEWRLWARLETLAGLEGELGFSAIRRLREGRLSQADLARVVAAAIRGAVAPFVLPEASPSYFAAFDSYREAAASLGGPDLDAKGALLRVRDLRAAAEAVVRGRALFILGPAEIADWLGRGSDNHPEAFRLPGRGSEGSSWVLGRTEAFFLSPASGRRAARAAADLATHLTSEAMAKAFGSRLSGDFYHWKEAPKRGEAPLVAGPGQSMDPERSSEGK